MGSLTIAEIPRMLELHANWLSNSDIDDPGRMIGDGIDFHCGDWRVSSMSCAVLLDSMFDKCQLTGVDFFDSELQGSSFEAAILTHANLAKCNLDGCVFSSAVLDHIKGRKVSSWDADFRHASLVEADLSFATFCRTDFSGANMTGVNLDGCRFYDCVFLETVLTGATGIHSVVVDDGFVVDCGGVSTELESAEAITWLAAKASV